MKGFKKEVVRSDLLSGYFLRGSQWRMVRQAGKHLEATAKS